MLHMQQGPSDCVPCLRCWCHGADLGEIKSPDPLRRWQCERTSCGSPARAAPRMPARRPPPAATAPTRSRFIASHAAATRLHMWANQTCTQPRTAAKDAFSGGADHERSAAARTVALAYTPCPHDAAGCQPAPRRPRAPRGLHKPTGRSSQASFGCHIVCRHEDGLAKRC